MSFQRFCQQVGFHPEPFQRRIARAAAGPEREFLASLPRGQGKTCLIAAIALHHLVTVERAAIYLAAASREQARIAFEYAAGFARVLGHPNVVYRHLELRYCPDPDEPRVFSRHLRVLAADAPRLHGLTFSLSILDELQAHGSDEVYVALSSALHKRPDAKMLVISTAGQGADSPLGRLRARGLAQPNVTRRGAVTDARGRGLRMLEWSLDEDASLDDMRRLKACNPASWVTAEQLADRREALPELAFRRFVANQWTEREGHWLPPGAWQACVGEPDFTPGEKVWVGVDVGGERSASAVVWVNERLHVGVGIYHGDRGVLDCIDHVRELAETYSVAEVIHDPMRFAQAAQELERERLTVVAFPQTDQRMIPASNALHAAITERRLVLPNDSELAQHAANTIARHGRRGWRVDKPNARTHIDAIVALAMAVERAEHREPAAQLVGWL